VGFHHCDIGVVDIFVDAHQETFGAGFAFRDEFDVLHLEHFFDDAAVVRGHHLRAVVPVGLIAVVLRGVVARSDDDAGIRAEHTDRI